MTQKQKLNQISDGRYLDEVESGFRKGGTQ